MDSVRPETIDRVDDVKVLRIFGMWCPNCAQSCEKRIQALSGVSNVVVDFGASQLRLKYDPTKVDFEKVKRTIRDLGFSSLDPLASEGVDTDFQRSTAPRNYFFSLAVSGSLSMWVTLVHIWVYFAEPASLARKWIFVFSGTLTFIVLALGGLPFIKTAWNTWRSRLFSLDQVIVTGAASLCLYSWLNVFRSSDAIYFDSVSMTITILLFVRWLDFKLRTEAGSRSPYWNFLNRSFEVTRVTTEGKIKTVAHNLSRGKVFEASHGTVPLDGVIESGQLLLNESIWTGEERPVRRTVGQQIHAGTEIVGGSAQVKVTNPVGDRSIDRMYLSHEGAMSRQAKTKTLTDRIYSFWIPSLFTLALLLSLLYLFVFDQNPLKVFALTLLIGCPCVFIVATTALRTIASESARRARLQIRDLDFFYKLKDVTTFIFDKTGTLTSPQFLRNEIEMPGVSEEQKAAAYFALAQIQHPISQIFKEKLRGDENYHIGYSITRAGEGTEIQMQDFGVFRIGRASFAKFPREMDSQRFYVSLNEKPIFSFDFEEDVSPSTEALLREIRRRGHKIVLASGDNRLPDRLEDLRSLFETVLLDCRPQDKKNLVNELSAREKVCFIGDGINDLKALGSADLSIAVFNTDRGIGPTGSLHLPQQEVPRLMFWHDYFQKLERTEKQTIFIGLSYNVLLLVVNGVLGLHPLFVLISFAAVSLLSLSPLFFLGFRS